jgi:hypothetical protein
MRIKHIAKPPFDFAFCGFDDRDGHGGDVFMHSISYYAQCSDFTDDGSWCEDCVHSPQLAMGLLSVLEWL